PWRAGVAWGAPVQGGSSVVHVLVHRLRPCSTPALMQTNPAAHCGSPCCAIGAHASPNPGRPPVLSVPPSVAASGDAPLLLHPNATNRRRTAVARDHASTAGGIPPTLRHLR